jgi:hypothetical protein
MPGPLFSNNASGALAGNYNAAATVISLNTGQGAPFPQPTGGDWFMATITNAANAIEIVRVTQRAVDTFTVVRGQEGTTARALALGDKIENRLTAGDLTVLRNTPIDPSTLPINSIDAKVLIPLSITQGKIFDGAITTSKILDGNVTAAKLAAGAALANLGYTPVHQGGGVGQLTDNIFLGWTNANKLALTVDATDLGYILTELQDGSAASAGYRGMPPNYQDNNYIIGISDVGRTVVHSSGLHTYTAPGDTTAINPGGLVQILNKVGAGAVTIAPGGGGAQLIWLPSGAGGARTLAAPGVATLQKAEAGVWYVYGAGLS